MIKATPLAIPDKLLVGPKVSGDEPGFFFESSKQARFEEVVGKSMQFVQDEHSRSRSARGALRGFLCQIQQPQGKLARVAQGKVFDAAVNLRKNSKTFDQWVGASLSADNKHPRWVPKGFAHGFVVLSETAEFFYKTTDDYAPEHERCIDWNDPALNIQWPRGLTPALSIKDAQGKTFADAGVFA